MTEAHNGKPAVEARHQVAAQEVGEDAVADAPAADAPLADASVADASATSTERERSRTLLVLMMWGAALVAVVFLARAPEASLPGEVAVSSSQSGPTAGVTPGESRVEPPNASEPTAADAAREYRGGRQHSGRTTATGPSNVVVAWGYKTEGPIASTPSVSLDGTIYVTSWDCHLYALTRHGSLRFKKCLGDRIYASPVVDEEGHIYVGSDADAFYSLDAQGRERWRLDTAGDADTAATFGPDGDVYFAAGRALYRVSREGVLRWRFEAREKIYTSPVVGPDGSAYVGAQDDRLYGISPSGELRWAYRTGGDNDTSGVLVGDTLYFGSDDKRVYALSVDGELKWSRRVDGFVRAPLAHGRDGSILVATFGPSPKVLALDPADGRTRWAFKLTLTDSAELGVRSGPVVDAEGTIYVGGHDDFIYALSPGGELRWVHGVQGDVDGSVRIANDGVLYVGAEDGIVYALRSGVPAPLKPLEAPADESRDGQTQAGRPESKLAPGQPASP